MDYYRRKWNDIMNRETQNYLPENAVQRTFSDKTPFFFFETHNINFEIMTVHSCRDALISLDILFFCHWFYHCKNAIITGCKVSKNNDLFKVNLSSQKSTQITILKSMGFSYLDLNNFDYICNSPIRSSKSFPQLFSLI